MLLLLMLLLPFGIGVSYGSIRSWFFSLPFKLLPFDSCWLFRSDLFRLLWSSYVWLCSSSSNFVRWLIRRLFVFIDVDRRRHLCRLLSLTLPFEPPELELSTELVII